MKFTILLSGILLIAFFLLNINTIPAQKNNYTNAHVSYNVTVEHSKYKIRYTFKDHFNQYQEFAFAFPEDVVNRDIQKFGVPAWMLDPYPDTEQNRKHQIKVLADGLFTLNGNIIEVDKSAAVDYYADAYCFPIAEQIVQALGKIGKDSRRNRIEMAMRFVQDIPYGIPKFSDKAKHYGGVNPPPLTLVKMYGDCDSKALLFAGILIFLIDQEDVIFLNQEKHVLTAIRDEPEKGLTYIRFERKNFLIAETAGPGARLLGEKGNYYSRKFEVEKLEVPIRKIIPKDTSSPTQAILAEPIIYIRNYSLKDLRFQISRDKNRWKDFSIPPGETGKFNFESTGIAYLRLPPKNQTSIQYDLAIGNSYDFYWNNRKKQWEVN